MHYPLTVSYYTVQWNSRSTNEAEAAVGGETQKNRFGRSTASWRRYGVRSIGGPRRRRSR